MNQTRRKTRLFIVQTALVLALTQMEQANTLIITSVIAGNKKFKTVSFDSKFLKPLTFEKDLPSTEFRRHRTVRPPKFDIDVNIPIKLPLEDEYYKEEQKKPVESDIFFQTGEIHEPGYGIKNGYSTTRDNNYKKPIKYTDEQYAASSEIQPSEVAASASSFMRDGLKGLLPTLAKSIKFKPKIEYESAIKHSNARADSPVVINPSSPNNIINNIAPNWSSQYQQQQFVSQQHQDPMVQAGSYQGANYAYEPKPQSNGYDQEFIPGGFINLQLSGPTGGPKMTYEDYDKERWAQQLSQTEGAMPYPILNYHQLQNYYGGLGTFTNGLAEHRYFEHSLLDKFKSSLNHITSKLHIG